MISGLEIMKANWQMDQDALSIVRRKVFIEEQNVPEELELDEHDKDCAHVLVKDADNQPIAAGRLMPDGKIGRMAVLKVYRNKGVGSAVLRTLIELANEQHCKSVYLHAQTTAIPFYEKYGFVVSSDEFMDAGIPHRAMLLVD